jgi:hypothetical protein
MDVIANHIERPSSCPALFSDGSFTVENNRQTVAAHSLGRRSGIIEAMSFIMR